MTIQEKKRMTNSELQRVVELISEHFFQRPFLHTASFNSRLKSTGGRYHLNSHRLDFNPKVLERYGKEELIGVIKHELCHYHLHLENKGYRHRDKDFKVLLQKTGGSRYVQPLIDQKKITYQHYQCENCQQFIYRKRRIDTTRYVCGKCHGKLIEKNTKYSACAEQDKQ